MFKEKRVKKERRKFGSLNKSSTFASEFEKRFGFKIEMYETWIKQIYNDIGCYKCTIRRSKQE